MLCYAWCLVAKFLESRMFTCFAFLKDTSLANELLTVLQSPKESSSVIANDALWHSKSAKKIHGAVKEFRDH